MKTLNKGDIVIRTNKNWDQPRKMIGKMYKIFYFNSIYKRVDISGGWSIDEKDYRVASDNEIRAFNIGVRHINNIKNSVDEYSII